jgi:hypothetical protein
MPICVLVSVQKLHQRQLCRFSALLKIYIYVISVEHSNIIAHILFGSCCMYTKKPEEATIVCSSLSKSAFSYAMFFLLLCSKLWNSLRHVSLKIDSVKLKYHSTSSISPSYQSQPSIIYIQRSQGEQQCSFFLLLFKISEYQLSCFSSWIRLIYQCDFYISLFFAVQSPLEIHQTTRRYCSCVFFSV